MVKPYIIIVVLLFATEAVHASDTTPHLWWRHEFLKFDIDGCIRKSKVSLEKNGFQEISMNDKYHFIYANKDQMRAGIQCVKQGDTSLVYINVAGNDMNSLKEARNQIIFKIR